MAQARDGSRAVYLMTLGCPKNQVDSEIMVGLLAGAGHRLVLDPGEADVLLVNTCGFIDAAKEESIDAILELARYKTDGSAERLVVAGCLVQRYPDELRKALPEVDAFLGTGELRRVADLVGSPERGVYVGVPQVLPSVTLPRVPLSDFYTAYLKVSEGCDRRCSFCAIPAIRGRHRSRPLDDVVAEAEVLARGGVRELNLIAQDLTVYGRDLGENVTLERLLRALAEVDGVRWIRCLYWYPSWVTKSLLDTVAHEEKVCSYVDMPLQHGSDRILRAMGRAPSADALRRLIALVRDRVPGVVLRSAFIVGFPGETDKDFEALCEFVGEIAADRVGVFCYSHEEGTVAGARRDDLPPEVKRRRRHELMEVQRQISAAKQQALVGTVQEVLVCGVDQDGAWYGRTAGQAPEVDGVVFLAGGELEAGDFVRARVTGATDYDLLATVLDDDGRANLRGGASMVRSGGG